MPTRIMAYSFRLLLQYVVVFTVLIPFGTCQEPASILARYSDSATNVLGERLDRLFSRLEQFRVPIQPGAATNPSPPPLPASTGGGGTLPGGNNVVGPKYRTIIENPGKGVTATSALIVLHGMGGTPEQLRLLAFPAREELPRTRFIFVGAPVQYVTYLKRKTESWFNIRSRRPGYEVVSEMRAAAAGVTRIVEEQRQQGIPGNKVVILGMSQGGAVALTFYLAEPTKVAGVIGTATWLPIPNQWNRNALPPANAGTPCFIQHGTKDAVIPISEAFESANTLTRLGRSTKYRSYEDGGHSLMTRFATVVSDIFSETKRMIGE